MLGLLLSLLNSKLTNLDENYSVNAKYQAVMFLASICSIHL